jgi:hypothetical protein
MDSNYQWQKQQANERHAARLRDAQAHRLLKGDSAQRGQQQPEARFSLWRLLASMFKRETQQASRQGRWTGRRVERG